MCIRDSIESGCKVHKQASKHRAPHLGGALAYDTHDMQINSYHCFVDVMKLRLARSHQLLCPVLSRASNPPDVELWKRNLGLPVERSFS